jgi:dTDP-4-amino-4,6-dideoxygalactose transaminase
MPEAGPGRHVWNQLCVSVPERDALQKALRAQDIATEVYYPVPLHLQPCFRYLGHAPGDFPRAEQAAASLLALPIYPGLAPGDIARVADAISAFYAGRALG